MKTSTKIWIVIFIISTVASALFMPFVFSRISVVGGNIVFNFDVYAWTAVGVTAISTFSSLVLFSKIIGRLKLPQKLFVMTAPLTITFAALTYFTATLNSYKSPEIVAVRRILNINTTNNNNILWATFFTIIYLVFLFVSYYIACKPVNKIEKYVNRLGDGRVKSEIEIGGGKQFKQIEYSLNKINDNYKQSENLIRKTNLETEKFIPKQFLKFLGKNSVLDLELGNKVTKEATTMFCDIRNSTAVSTTLSLEDNFNHINSYLNVVAPIIRKNGGFIDKYMGDGILAVFTEPQTAIECAHSIVKVIENKNLTNKKLPNLDVGISIHTGDVVFGIVGEEERKSPTIISDSVNIAGKMEQLNREIGTTIIFSKSTLNNLSTKYPLSYRYIGNMKFDNKGDSVSVFESLDCYTRQKREILTKNKREFEEAVRLFIVGKFEQAKQSFQAVYKKEKEDKVCYLYYNKCVENLRGGKSPLRI